MEHLQYTQIEKDAQPAPVQASTKFVVAVMPLMGTNGWDACSSTYKNPQSNSTPMTRMKYVYGVFHETMGAWLKAKLNKARPDTPKKVPAPSICFQRLTSDLLIVVAAGGKISIDTPASAIHTAAVVQNAHGHETTSANIAAMAPPTTNPRGAAAPSRLIMIFLLGPGG
jgi:hypothetical protein